MVLPELVAAKVVVADELAMKPTSKAKVDPAERVMTRAFVPDA